jgi:hypothetical protein
MLSYAPAARRSTISTVRHTNTSTWSQHAAYLQREGAQLEQEHGLGWDRGDGVDMRGRLAEWRRDGETEMLKVIVSPEEGKDLDLKAHVRALVEKMEKDSGQQLDWCAIDHHNTSHSHVHLLVCGHAKEGEPLSVSDTYIRTELQAYSRELATDALGYRSEKQIQLGFDRLAGTINKTSLDTELVRIFGKRDRLVDLGRADQQQRRALEKRHEYLETHGLAKRAPRGWLTKPHFDKTLRTIGLQHNTQASLARGRVTPSTPDLRVSLRPLERGEHLVGVLIDAGKVKDRAKTPWALLETTSGELRYLEGPEVGQVAAARLAKSLRSSVTIALRDPRPAPQKLIFNHQEITNDQTSWSRRQRSCGSAMAWNSRGGGGSNADGAAGIADRNQCDGAGSFARVIAWT